MTRRRPAGFTLVELLVALALTGLVSLLILAGMRDATLGLDRVARHADALDRRVGLDDMLRRALATAVPQAPRPGQPAFVGRRHKLRFFSLESAGAPGLYRLVVAFAAGQRDRPLILTRRLADPLGLPQIERTVLARHLRDARFAYFGAAKPGADPAWHSRWDHLRYPPRAVRLDIENGAGTISPPLVIRLWAAPR